MTYREAIECFVSRHESFALSDKCAEAEQLALNALISQGEPEYPICECCGKKIDHIGATAG